MSRGRTAFNTSLLAIVANACWKWESHSDLQSGMEIGETLAKEPDSALRWRQWPAFKQATHRGHESRTVNGYTSSLGPLLLYGLILCVLMSILIVGGLRLNAEIWIHDYPPDIREKYGPISDQGRQQRLLFAIPIYLVPIAVLALSLLRLHNRRGAKLSFGSAFLVGFIAFSVFNVFDLMCLDWLLFVWSQPDFVVLPGTEGMAGYSDYTFHGKSFLVGTALTTVIAWAAAGTYRHLVA